MACLLELVHREEECVNHNGAEGNAEVSYEQWLQSLSERICKVFSNNLGRGRKGTDTYEDDRAWLCLSRTVNRLVTFDDIDGDIKEIGSGKKTSLLKDFKLSLSYCILNSAFKNDQEGDNIVYSNDDWVSLDVDEEIKIWKAPAGTCSSRSWKAMAMASVGLTRLATSLSDNEATRCFALVDICTVCFQLGIVDLQPKILYRCMKDDREKDIIENDTVEISKDSSCRVDDIEKHALHTAFERLEVISERISTQSKALILQNNCFFWVSRMAESLRNYARLQKGPFAPQPGKNAVGDSTVMQQTKLHTFFSNDIPRKK